jgi:guanyl-specific ribonuclease Sa
MWFPRTRRLTGTLLAVCALAAWALPGCAPLAAESPEPNPVPQEAGASGHHPRHHAHHHGDRAEPAEQQPNPGPDEPARPHGAREREDRPAATAEVPEKVIEVLRFIDKHHRAPDEYEGGREFHNAGRDGEQPLPRTDARGRPLTYQEWDVNPKTPGVNRGAERLVTGSDGSAYYTADHYRTFTKVR